MSKLLKHESLSADVSNKRPLRHWHLLKQVLYQRVTIAIICNVILWIPLVAVGLNPTWGTAISDAWYAFLFAAPLALFLVIIWFVWQDFIQPWLYLRGWLLEMHSGNLSARIPPLENSSSASLCDNLNSLAQMLESQSNHAERQLREHTQHIAEKNRLLNTLYQIVSSLNTASFDDMFTQVLKTINEELNIDAIIIRKRLNNGQMQKLASVGNISDTEDKQNLAADSLLLQSSTAARRLVVPLQYRNRMVGTCSFYLDHKRIKQHKALEELLSNIGRHLGIAIEKARLDEENLWLSVMEERTWLANELHDSLAQTISSLRLQIRVLDQNLHAGNEAMTWQNLERVENAVEEAYREVRNLIEYFKGYSVTRPGLSAVDQLMVQFQRDNPDIRVVLDNRNWNAPQLPAEHALQVFRIIQEALTNASKHGKADFIRVLLRTNADGEHFVLIEDNGIGIQENQSSDTTNATTSANNEKHFGLTVMHERAKSIGGHLDIDSELGEGVRITLRFHYPTEQNS